jgi:hypothetical protein
LKRHVIDAFSLDILTDGGGVKKMRKGGKILMVLAIVLFAIQPIAQSLNLSINSPKEKPVDIETSKIICYVISPDRNRERIIKEIPQENYNKIVEMGRSLFEDFMIIYNPDSTEDEVNVAFNNVRPFFTAIVNNQLTDKSVEELEFLYREIRNKIAERWQSNRDKIISKGWWNGIWTPMFVNGGCGIMAEAKRCQGFVIGTHSIIPTIGADILLTYFTSDLTAVTETIGVTGWTGAHGPQMAFIINYIGILLGEIPIVSYMVFALLIGYAMFYAGASIL